MFFLRFVLYVLCKLHWYLILSEELDSLHPILGKWHPDPKFAKNYHSIPFFFLFFLFLFIFLTNATNQSLKKK